MAKKRQYKYSISEVMWSDDTLSSEQRAVIFASNQRVAESKARDLYPGKRLNVVRVYKWIEKTSPAGKFDPSQYR